MTVSTANGLQVLTGLATWQNSSIGLFSLSVICKSRQGKVPAGFLLKKARFQFYFKIMDVLYEN